MRNRLVRLVLVFSLLAMVVGLGVVAQAQDTTATGVTCDSDLVLSLYVAQRYLGFNDVRNSISSTSTSPMLDLNSFNYGQYQPLFDNINNMSATGGLVAEATPQVDSTTNFIQPGSRWNDEWSAGVTSSLMQDDPTFEQNYLSNAFPGTDTSTMTPLASSSVAGEAAECTQLRTELNRFYRALAFQDVSGFMVDQG
jgi:hypothetical protein